MTPGEEALREAARLERAHVLTSTARPSCSSAATEPVAHMLRRGCLVRTIARDTGLTVEQVQSIAAAHGIVPRREPRPRRHLTIVRKEAG